MIDRDEAIRRAKAAVAAAHPSDSVVLLEEHTREESFGWVFFWQSEAYVKSGDFLYQLLGNAPLVVFRDSGDLVFTGTAEPVDHYLDEIRRDRDLFISGHFSPQCP